MVNTIMYDYMELRFAYYLVKNMDNNNAES